MILRPDASVGLTFEANLLANGVSNGGSVVTPPGVNLSSPFPVLELFEMLQRQQLLGSNCFCPLSELGFDSNNVVAPRQFWEDPLLIEKGLGTCSLVVAPLALWDPNGGLDFGTEVSVIDGFSSEDDLKASEWMRAMIKGFGSYVGFPIACCES